MIKNYIMFFYVMSVKHISVYMLLYSTMYYSLWVI